ncbi:hypothetical protein [Baaleninema simplex]|uniref:hypothetical protein n=1 Tax=Baaleninema simplex TaxID=2862350 RepID=UPI00034CFBC5|nr:hypothetical protein [Baaleninema simplex]
MSSRQEAVVFIPGYQFQEQGFYLELLSAGLTEQLEQNRVTLAGDVKIQGNTGKRFEVVTFLDNHKTVDVYEAYWGDLLIKLSDRSIKDKALYGAYLFFYWLFSKTWKYFKESPVFFINGSLTLVLWLFWYYGTLSIIFTAIGKDPSFLGFEIPQNLARYLGTLGTFMGGWSIWVIVQGLLDLLPVNFMVDIIYFAMKYIEEDSPSRVLRAKIRNRIFSIFDDILNEGCYDKVTVVSHSFGVTVAVDLLADYQGAKSVRLITLGGPLKILSCKVDWIEREIQKCLENDRIDPWLDFYSDRDWLCTKTPIPKNSTSKKIQYRRNDLPFSLVKQLSGRSHLHYFTDKTVLATILNLDEN